MRVPAAGLEAGIKFPMPRRAPCPPEGQQLEAGKGGAPRPGHGDRQPGIRASRQPSYASGPVTSNMSIAGVFTRNPSTLEG